MVVECGRVVVVVEFVVDTLTTFAFESNAVASLGQETLEVAVRLSQIEKNNQ